LVAINYCLVSERTGAHSYGFNGKEKDDEVKGAGNELDFGARIFDPRIGRFLTLDPRMREYSGWSPYLFAANNPIILIDINGEGVDDREKGAPAKVDKLNHDIDAGEGTEFSRKDENPFKSDGHHDLVVPPTKNSGSFTQSATGHTNSFDQRDNSNIIEDLYAAPAPVTSVYEKTRQVSWAYNKDRTEITITTKTTLTSLPTMAGASVNTLFQPTTPNDGAVQVITTSAETFKVQSAIQAHLFTPDVNFYQLGQRISGTSSSSTLKGNQVKPSALLLNQREEADREFSMDLMTERYKQKIESLQEPHH